MKFKILTFYSSLFPLFVSDYAAVRTSSQHASAPLHPTPTPPRTALWDVTNGVLCLKDCGVCCECSAGQSEVNYLGLNTYFVPLQG